MKTPYTDALIAFQNQLTAFIEADRNQTNTLATLPIYQGVARDKARTLRDLEKVKLLWLYNNLLTQLQNAGIEPNVTLPK